MLIHQYQFTEALLLATVFRIISSKSEIPGLKIAGKANFQMIANCGQKSLGINLMLEHNQEHSL